MTDQGGCGETSATGPTVLFLDNSFTFGGAIVSLNRLVKGLDGLGVQSLIVSGQPLSVLHDLFGEDRTMQAQIRVPWRHQTALQRHLNSRPAKSGPLSRIVRELSNLDWVARRTIPDGVKLTWIGLQHDVDIVHLNNALESQIHGLLAAKLLGVPCVAHARGFQRGGRLVETVVGRVDRHIAISQAIESDLLRIGAPPERISLIHDAVDTDEYAEPGDTESLRRAIGISADARVFGFVGRIVEWKGVEEFVSAAVRVLEDHPDAVALVVGDESDGYRSYYRHVQEAARRSSVRDRLKFTGYRDDVPAIMGLLDVLVHTSTEPEPFGLVLVEAMAAETPVVAANRGGPLDIVADGETGFLVDPEDTEAVATAVSRLLENPRLARKFGRAGKRRAEDEFSVGRYARNVAGVYREVCERGATAGRERR